MTAEGINRSFDYDIINGNIVLRDDVIGGDSSIIDPEDIATIEARRFREDREDLLGLENNGPRKQEVSQRPLKEVDEGDSL